MPAIFFIQQIIIEKVRGTAEKTNGLLLGTSLGHPTGYTAIEVPAF